MLPGQKIKPGECRVRCPVYVNRVCFEAHALAVEDSPARSRRPVSLLARLRRNG